MNSIQFGCFFSGLPIQIRVGVNVEMRGYVESALSPSPCKGEEQDDVDTAEGDSVRAYLIVILLFLHKHLGQSKHYSTNQHYADQGR